MADDDKSFRQRVEEIRQERASGTESVESVKYDDVKQLAERAKNETVSAQRLVGDEEYFHQIVSYLEDDEQPHFLFPLTKGITAQSALMVESGAEREELLGKLDGGTCSITNKYVRIVSEKGEWTIPYNSVVSVDFVGHPELHIQTSGRTYYIRIAGTLFNEEENLSEAATYIRERQRESASGASDTDEDPLERLEKLGELRDEGLISDEEFQNKKQELLDDV